MKIVRSEQKIPFEAKDGSEIRELLRSESEWMSLAEATVREETKLHLHKTSDEIYHQLFQSQKPRTKFISGFNSKR